MRAKLCKFYFQRDFDVQPFVNMDILLMPHVLEFVTKTKVCIEKEERTYNAKEMMTHTAKMFHITTK